MKKKHRRRKAANGGTSALTIAAPSGAAIRRAEEAIKRVCRDRSLTSKERVAALGAIQAAASQQVAITNCVFEMRK